MSCVVDELSKDLQRERMRRFAGGWILDYGTRDSVTQNTLDAKDPIIGYLIQKEVEMVFKLLGPLLLYESHAPH